MHLEVRTDLATGKIRVTAKDPQANFDLLLPVIQTGWPRDTVEVAARGLGQTGNPQSVQSLLAALPRELAQVQMNRSSHIAFCQIFAKSIDIQPGKPYYFGAILLFGYYRR